MSEEKKTAEAAGGAEGGDKGTAKKAPAAAAKREKTKKSPWTEARCMKAARRFTTATEWESGAPSSFKAATARGWLKDCTAHMGKSGITNIKAGKKTTTTTKPTHKKSA